MRGGRDPVAGPREIVETTPLRKPAWPWAEGEKRIKKEKAQRADERLDDSKRTRKRGPLLKRIHRGEIRKEELDNALAAGDPRGFRIRRGS